MSQDLDRLTRPLSGESGNTSLARDAADPFEVTQTIHDPDSPSHRRGAVGEQGTERAETVLAVQVPTELVDEIAKEAAALLDEQMDGFLDVEGAAKFLGGCSHKRIYNLVERDSLPHYKAGGRLLFDRNHLRRWVERSQ
jgi:excisionase family DNA binding protein